MPKDGRKNSIPDGEDPVRKKKRSRRKNGASGDDGKPKPKMRTIYFYPEPKKNSDYFIVYIMHGWLKRRYDHLFSPCLLSYRSKSGIPKAVSYLKGEMEKKGDLEDRFGYKADVSKYFHSIDLDMLVRDLRRTISPDACHYIEKLLMTGRNFEDAEGYDPPGIYAGLPTGGFLANFYLRNLDAYFAGRDVTYCRYADDILLFADTAKERDHYEKMILAHLKRRHLTVQPNKREKYPGDNTIEFLGLYYRNGKFDINEKSYLRRKEKIRRLCAIARKKISGTLAEYSVAPPRGRASRKPFERMLNGLGPKRNFKVKNGPLVSQSPLYPEIKALIKWIQRGYYGTPYDPERSFMGWYYPLIGTDKTLRKIDQFCLQEIRYAITGLRGLEAMKLVPYKYLKENYGYRPLVHEMHHRESLKRKS